MDIRLIEQIVAEQREEIARFKVRDICPRAEEDFIDLESELAQVVMGVRRSGKSTLCLQKLVSSGTLFGYINFDDERLAEIRGKDLNDLLTAVYRSVGDVDLLFFDEIQNVLEWPLFVNRLLRVGKHIVLTGSNAKLLGTELATHLTGRSHEITLLPFSFRDVCVLRGISPTGRTALAQGLLRRAWEEYLTRGGFPQIVRGMVPIRDFLSDLFKNILERDIAQRHHIRRMEPFRLLAEHLLNVAPTIVNTRALANRFGNDLSADTVRKFIEYLKQAYLLVGVRKYSAKSHLRLRNERLYPVDVALMDNRPDTLADENRGWRLETIVLIELLRRARRERTDVYFYQEGATEIDFLVCRANEPRAAYQVAYDLSNPKTRARELRAFSRLAGKIGDAEFYLITDSLYEDVRLPSGKTVKIRPAYEWLVTP